MFKIIFASTILMLPILCFAQIPDFQQVGSTMHLLGRSIADVHGAQKQQVLPSNATIYGMYSLRRANARFIDLNPLRITLNAKGRPIELEWYDTTNLLTGLYRYQYLNDTILVKQTLFRNLSTVIGTPPIWVPHVAHVLNPTTLFADSIIHYTYVSSRYLPGVGSFVIKRGNSVDTVYEFVERSVRHRFHVRWRDANGRFYKDSTIARYSWHRGGASFLSYDNHNRVSSIINPSLRDSSFFQYLQDTLKVVSRLSNGERFFKKISPIPDLARTFELNNSFDIVVQDRNTQDQWGFHNAHYGQQIYTKPNGDFNIRIHKRFRTYAPDGMLTAVTYEDSMTLGNGQFVTQTSQYSPRFSFSLTPIVSVPKKSSEHVSLFPSPATEFIRISGLLNDALLTIRTIDGKVMVKTGFSPSETVDVSSLPHGLYYVTVQQGSSSQTLKFVKQ